MSDPIKVLALEPYYGGSHKIFLDWLAADSCHDWEIMTLPPRKWKWRMMHSAVTFADQLAQQSSNQSIVKSPGYQIIFCTDMLNLAEFKGLMPAQFANIPVVVYFHENQLTYPTHYEKSKDRYFGWINITTALAADAVWFNSEYHMNSFLEAVTDRIRKAPDCRPANLADLIRAKSIVVPQGIREFDAGAVGSHVSAALHHPGGERMPGPLRILWAARWEFDKNPGDFFDAIRMVRAMGIDFRLSVIGGKSRNEECIFLQAEKEFADNIDHWGFIENNEEYEKVLSESDIAVSTAIHEFFGISIAEAVSAGAFPLVPNRLAYPEVLKENSDDEGRESFFYDGTPADLAEKIANCAKRLQESDSLWQGDEQRGIRKISRFYQNNIIAEVDKRIASTAT